MRARSAAQGLCGAQNGFMKQVVKWLVLAGLVFFIIAATVLWAVQRWVSSENFRLQAEREASRALGVAVELARIDVALWPLPAVALEGIQIQTSPPLTLERLEVRPLWQGLLLGRLELSTVLVRGATLPQTGVDAVLLLLQKKKQEQKPAQPGQEAPMPEADQAFDPRYIPARTVLENVTWLNTRGERLTLQADAHLSPSGLPDDLSLKILEGTLKGATAQLTRQGTDWTLAMAVGEGTVKGSFELQPAPEPGAPFYLRGQLQTRGVKLAALTSAPPVLSGRLDADTTLSVRSATLGALLAALQTTSQFTVHNAVLHGIDLEKAVKTVGLSRGGVTPLDTLTGQMTSRGEALQFNQLLARSGVLSASGDVAVTPGGALSGRVSVDLAAAALGNAVAVPLEVGGTLEAPNVTLTRSALMGAAVGTVLLPGVGTGAGASIGERISEGFKKLFGK